MIADYAPTAGATRTGLAGYNHLQPGDPVKAAAAIVGLPGLAKPPLRLPLGPDAVARIEAKLDLVRQELIEYRAQAMATDLDRSGHAG